MCFVCLYKFVWNISHSKKNWASRDQNVYRSSCKVSVILVRFQWNLKFLDRFSINTQMWNFMKILPVGAELLYPDTRTRWRTDRHDEANSALFPVFRTCLKINSYVRVNRTDRLIFVRERVAVDFVKQRNTNCWKKTQMLGFVYEVKKNTMGEDCTQPSV